MFTMQDKREAAEVALTFLEGTLNAADFDVPSAVSSWLEGFPAKDVHRELICALRGFDELQTSVELRRIMEVSEKAWAFFGAHYVPAARQEMLNALDDIEKVHPELSGRDRGL
jgi:hypothetical protein